jgi:putative ubiquitin-RnfH superfamily antitoxin RatB of RatAB toxin-antitoxin module
MSGGTKRCTVVYATRERQRLWTVELPAQASVGDALAAARHQATADPGLAQIVEDLPWASAPVGIFGELVDRAYVPEDGDRIEIYRPLEHDPRLTRRERARRHRVRGR